MNSYDIARVASIYSDSQGERWWTKAWFNNKEKGESAVEITRALAIAFVKDEIKKDAWLSRFFPKQMEVIGKAITETRKQLLSQ